MSISPNRKAKQILTAYKQTYSNNLVAYSTTNPTIKKTAREYRPQETTAHKTQLDYSKKKLGQLRTSIIIEETKNRKDEIIQQLEKKLQTIQKQNAYLLGQNKSLSQVIAQKNTQIEIQANKFSVQFEAQRTHLIQIQNERNRILLELQSHHYQHKQQVDKLLQEISELHNNCYTIEGSKNSQIQKLKQAFQKQTFLQIQNLKKSQNGSIELYETQIKKLKQIMDTKNYQIENINHVNKSNKDKLQQQIKHLNAQIKHLVQMKQLQLNQCINHYENELQNQLKQYKRSHQLYVNSNQSIIKKLKKQLTDKSLQIEKLINKMQKQSSQNQAQLGLLKDQKERLRVQIEQLEQQHRNTLKTEKQHLLKLAQAECQNLENTNINYTNSLKSQIEKLYQLTQYKTSQIKHLYNQIDDLRKNHGQQCQYLNKSNQQLKKKISEIQLANHEDLELLKIKIAQLHQADIKSIKDYLQNQIRILTEQNLSLQKIIRQSRERIHKQLQQKNQLRKTFQLELSKQKSKCYDLKIKLATISLQMKEQMTSMASKLQLTSQTFIRESKLKQKGTAFGQEQKKKLFHLIQLKDKQINQLVSTLQKMKQQQQIRNTQTNNQISELKKFIELLQINEKKNTSFYQNEIKKKQNKFKNQKQQLNELIKNAKAIAFQQLKFIIQNLEKQNAKFQKDIENSQRQINKLSQELALKSGFFETVQLQSSAALQEEKTRGQKLLGKHELNIKIFYQEKLKTKDVEINALKEQLIQKQQDIRDLIKKYNALQQRLGLMLQSQQKLRQFENKVMNLGMDNNLIKNLAELFKYKK